MFPTSVTFNGNHKKKPAETAGAFNDYSATISQKLASKIRSKTDDDHLHYLPADLSSTVPPFAFKRVDAHLLKSEID